MKPYSLDMRQKIVHTYEAGNTSVGKVAERFLVRQKYGTGTTQTKKRDRKITPSSGKRGETEPTLWSIVRTVFKQPEYHKTRLKEG
jgi:transposase